MPQSRSIPTLLPNNLTIKKADPSLIFDSLLAGDTDFWMGVVDDAGSDDDDKFQIGDGITPGTNPFLTIDTSGNVGIGTPGPAQKIHVVGNVKVQNDYPRIVLDDTGVGGGKRGWKSDGGGLISFAGEIGSETDYLVITSVGDVGMGTLTPDRLLHAEKASALTNTVQQVARLTHITSGAPAASIGLGLEFEQETSADNNEVIATHEVVVTDVTAGQEDADFVFRLMEAGAAAAERFRVTSGGALTVPTTITPPGTVGNQTINKAAGRVNIAAGGTTVTVTNSLVTANSIVLAVAATADVTARVTNVVPSAGSFVINTVAVTAETAFNWFVVG